LRPALTDQHDLKKTSAHASWRGHEGPGWWQASDLKWYPPEQHSDYVAPPPPDGQPQRPPPVQPPGSGPPQRSRTSIAIMPIIIGVAVVAAGITGYLLRPHSAASQSPTAQSATASSVPSAQPAPPPGPKPVEQSALLGLLLTPAKSPPRWAPAR
jgi:hypothetical protein